MSTKCLISPWLEPRFITTSYTSYLMHISWLHNDKHNLCEHLERNLSLNCHIKMTAYKERQRTTHFLTFWTQNQLSSILRYFRLFSQGSQCWLKPHVSWRCFYLCPIIYMYYTHTYICITYICNLCIHIYILIYMSKEVDI